MSDKVEEEDENIPSTSRDILLINLHPPSLPFRSWERFEIFFEGDVSTGCFTDPMGNSLLASLAKCLLSFRERMPQELYYEELRTVKHYSGVKFSTLYILSISVHPSEHKYSHSV